MTKHINNNHISLSMGEGYVGMAPRIICSKGLGSCVAVAIYDIGANIGGLAHVVLPLMQRRHEDVQFRYADIAVESILGEMYLLGSDLKKIVSKMAGGARIFSCYENDEVSIGEQNIISLRNVLRRKGIPITGEDIGGAHGRNVEFDLATGLLRITTIGKEVKEI